ncbi:ThiF domain-containing protein [Candidatus Hydrogenisulfobacillus filiaventi]|uniref:ThiF domain-containing protein n=1 Tax=Candidatus Hydrogenisulfobacillus filiaventi TaxID=2707344 RepID=A0A6F8ZGD4_9FIRM|nr:HesA/MoeB/ThiF family protein [Bacillota bacterium]CAB1128840.1 ThiF domain-containing protein [Candidatus Hydrogenisulfobacillus filiaventi]
MTTVAGDRERIRRLLTLPQVRPAQARRLAAARVAIIGMGGLGNAAAQYLAAQGVGQLLLLDPDRVEASNLGRQVLFDPTQVGLPKVEAAAARLSRQNPACMIRPVARAFTAVDGFAPGEVDLILDGTDNGATREVLNRVAVETGIPVIFAGAVGYEALVYGVGAGGRPCLQCAFGPVQEADRSCARDGILGPVVGLAGVLQAVEALKVLLEVGEPPWGRLWSWDLFHDHARVVRMPPREDCAVCGSRRASRGPETRGGTYADI